MSDNESPATRPWNIRLFSTLEAITPEGASILVTRRKAAELLAYLALYPDRPHSREKLMDVVWGDSEVGDIRLRLRQELSKLRALGTEPDKESGLLTITRDEVQLGPGTIVDVTQFLCLCRKANRSDDWTVKRTLLTQAVSHYRAPLLTGLETTWIVAERTRLAQIYSRALLDLAEAQRQLHDYAGAEEWLSTLLAHDPLLEEGHVALMRLFADMGQPTRVHQQYQKLERRLREELDVAPTATSAQLAKQLREEAAKQASDQATPAPQPKPKPQQIVAAEEVPSVPMPTLIEPGVAVVQISVTTPEAAQPSPQDATLRPAIKSRGWIAPLAVLLVTAIIAGLLSVPRHKPPSNPDATLPGFWPQWTYTYQPKAGELDNAEAKAAWSSGGTNFITGLQQMPESNACILSVALSQGGLEKGRDRYLSPENDCARGLACSYSVAGGYYAAGECYVPEGFALSKGWHMVLLQYGAAAERNWVVRSDVSSPVSNEHMAVLPTADNGCYLCGNMYDGKREMPVVIRYDKSGKVVWQCRVLCAGHAKMNDARLGPHESVYLCAKAQPSLASASSEIVWMAAAVSPDGKVLWNSLTNGQAPIHGSTCKLAVLPTGNLCVMGTIQAVGSPGVQLGVQLYDLEGRVGARGIVTGTGPAVTAKSLWPTETSDMLVAGNVTLADGRTEAVVGLFDSNCALIKTFRFNAINGVKNSDVSEVKLTLHREVDIAVRVWDLERVIDNNSVVVERISADGSIIRKHHFELYRNDHSDLGGMTGDEHPMIFGSWRDSRNGSHRVTFYATGY